jgi:hypothetical protein
MGRLLKSISIRRPANLHTKICLKKKDTKLKICYLFWKHLMLASAPIGNWQYFVMGYHEHIWFHQCQEDINQILVGRFAGRRIEIEFSSLPISIF